MSPAHRLKVDDVLKDNLYEMHALTNLGDNAYLAKLGCSDNRCLYRTLDGNGELFAHYIADDKSAHLGRAFLSSFIDAF